jgi:hypothetical protein
MQQLNQLPIQTTATSPPTTTGRKGKEAAREAKRRGERDKGNPLSRLASPCFVLLVPNLPPSFCCCHGASHPKQ